MADILRHQATLDPLTGLYNLRRLTTRLESLLEDSRDHNQPLALLVCDLDNLKPVNDSYGHHTGDRLLKEVARQLTAWSTMEYACWRTGGDEFAAVIPGGTFEEAVEAAADLQRTLATLRIPAAGGADIAISVSIGIASFPVDGLTGAALCRWPTCVCTMPRLAGRGL